MSILELNAIGIQVALPLLLLAWLVLAPMRNLAGFAIQALVLLAVLVALALTSIWIMPPWWVPYLYCTLWGLGVVTRLPVVLRTGRYCPVDRINYLTLALLIPFGAWSILLNYQAISGRTLPPGVETTSLSFPLGPGTYLIANGGSTPIINGHFFTFTPTTKRQRAYRGQSFAVDLVRINALGMRATGWRPTDPESYLIFADPVFAPCGGTVISARADMPDMPVPLPDETLLEGNHVLIECERYSVLLAHLKTGSLLVTVGQQVHRGQPLARVGNSGKTFEPHLHIHAQTQAEPGQPLLSGEPVHILFGETLPVRNQLLVARDLLAR